MVSSALEIVADGKKRNPSKEPPGAFSLDAAGYKSPPWDRAPVFQKRENPVAG